MDTQNVIHPTSREYLDPSRSVTLEDPGSEAHQFVIGVSDSGDIIEGEGGIQHI